MFVNDGKYLMMKHFLFSFTLWVNPVVLLITARLRRMGEGNIFNLFLPDGGYPTWTWERGTPCPTPHLDLGRSTLTPHPAWTWEGSTPWTWEGGSPPSRTGWGTPPAIRRQSSIASTCYAAGGIPLAFMQEDCLVTDHIRSMRGGNIFSLFVCPHPGGYLPSRWWGGYLLSGLDGGGTYLPGPGGGGYLPSGWWGGVPTLRSGWGGYLLSGLDGGGYLPR